MKGNHLEKILCIPEEILFEKEKWNGLKSEDLGYYKNIIQEKGEFRVRDELEGNPEYKQIVAHVVFKWKDKYFLHKQVDMNEKRLNNLCPLFIGGHIEEFDLESGGDLVEKALMRELDEEVQLGSNIVDKQFAGLLYLEDDNPVNWDHVGCIYIFELDGNDIELKEEGMEKIGFVSLDYLKTNKETLTYWSRILIYHL